MFLFFSLNFFLLTRSLTRVLFLALFFFDVVVDPIHIRSLLRDLLFATTYGKTAFFFFFGVEDEVSNDKHRLFGKKKDILCLSIRTTHITTLGLDIDVGRVGHAYMG